MAVAAPGAFRLRGSSEHAVVLPALLSSEELVEGTSSVSRIPSAGAGQLFASLSLPHDIEDQLDAA
jgi:hypothetical protein